ncbi:MAG TPA: hypothetical protein VLK33_03015, partial [Terriglobales bacterium]|nr:hypothetical protein [Terriglobales bacterium]
MPENGHNTEQDVAPNFWKWMLLALCAVVILALAATGVFYFSRGRKEKNQPPGTPQTRLLQPR